jgi:dienelactone hydrolase
MHRSRLLASFGLLVTALAAASSGCGNSASSTSTGTGGSGGTTGSGATGGASTSSGGDTTGSGGAPAGIQARFELPQSGAPAFLDVPFPSDLYLGANGLVGDIPGLDTYVKSGSSFLVAGLSALNGFGTTAGALFEIDDLTAGKPAAIDPKSLPATEADSTSAAATVMLVDLAAADAKSALVPARVDYHDDGGKARPLLVVYPARGVVLEEKHRYAAVLTTGVRTPDGQSVAASKTFAAVRDGAQRSTDAEKSYGDAIDALAKLVPALADRTKIAAIAAYTTNDASKELVAMRAGAMGQKNLVNLSWDAAALAPMGQGLFANAPLPPGFTATLDAWLGSPAALPDGSDDPAADQKTGRAHHAIAAIGTAVFSAPNYLVESAKGYGDAAHHNFARDASNNPIQSADKPSSKIWMTIVLPKAPVPASGYPVVVVQHGLGGDRSAALQTADLFARKGWATVAIESVTFGARASEADFTADATSGFAWSGGAGAYNGPDGFVDKRNGSNDFFGVLKDLGAVRDQMRQSVLDIGAAIDVVRSPTLDLGPLLLAVPGAKLDAGRVAFLGHSLGGIMGSMVAAVEPGVGAFVLNVAGAGLMTEIAPNSPGIAGLLALAGTANFGFTGAKLVPGHPLLHLIQHIVDPGDPLRYARSIVTSPATLNGKKNAPKNVIQIESLSDEWVANQANEALARAAGFPLAAPNAGSQTGIPLIEAMPVGGAISGVPVAGVTAVLVQAGPATHANELYDAKGTHHYAYPFPRFDQAVPFPPLAADITVNEPHDGLSAMMLGFLESAFAGGGAPVVKGFPAPVADYDGDGAPDKTDADPNDPAKQ